MKDSAECTELASPKMVGSTALLELCTVGAQSILHISIAQHV